MKNEKEILLSIIIPHFNEPNLLSKLLDTIPNCPQIEVIVIDDHSTEKIEELSQCKQKYINRNIHFYSNEDGRKGSGAARNIGIKYAIGEYFLFADADDYFLPDFWDYVSMCMSDRKDIIYFMPISKKSNGDNSNRSLYYAELVSKYLKNPIYQNELRLRYLYVPPWSKLIRRSMVVDNDIRFDETPVSNDVMFSAQIGNLARTIKASDKAIYCILEHAGSLTTRKDRDSLKIRQKVYCRYYFFMRKKLSWKEFRLLGFGFGSDYAQIKSVISIFLYEHHISRRKR